MKLLGLMSLQSDKDEIRKIFQKHEVHIYSEVDITGHTAKTMRQHGFWHTERDIPIYSTLYFAILNADKAEEIFNDMKNLVGDFDPQHPPRVFMVNVEKMI